MNFCTMDFILFAIVLAVLYYIVRPSGRWMVLLAGSLVFFAFGGWKYLLYAVVMSVVFFLAANMIDKINDRQSQLDRKQDKDVWAQLAGKSKRILVITIVLVVGNLVLNKYFNLLGELISNISAYLGGSGEIALWEIALPLGLSYYTFSGLGYILDVYWKRYRSQKNYAKFLLYIVYFPHIIQGPIERYGLLGNQFFDETKIRFDGERIRNALVWMGYGYFKKLFVADRISIFVNGVMAEPKGTAGSIQLFAILLSAAWIYADFSGYMDIAKGVSMIFGIEINQNFNHPFLSKSVPEWWRRWHMSLSSWWKDYIYMPMATSLRFISTCAKVKKKFGKNVGKFFKDAVPLLLIWTTTGLWHGTGATYLAWGLYFSLIFICSVTFAPAMTKLLQKLHINAESKCFHLFQIIRTYLLFCVGRLLTVPGSLGYTGSIVKNMFTNFNVNAIFTGSVYKQYGICIQELWFMFAGIAVIIIADCIEEYKQKTISQWVFDRNWFVRSLIYAAVIVAILVFGIYGVDFSMEGFAYQDF